MAVDENAGLSDGQPCIFWEMFIYVRKEPPPPAPPKGRAVKF